MDRRNFIKRITALSAFPNIITSDALGGNGRVSAGNRINLAGIGVGRMGRNDMGQFLRHPRIQVVAVCDVKHSNLDRAKGQAGGVDAYLDYREICARDDIDAVMCATPDHWHAQICIDAMKSGKDVYCEKPLTLTIAEGRKMVEAARRYNRVISGGSQRVIGDNGPKSAAARSGEFGSILAGFANPGGPPRHCYLPGKPVPPNTIEWDMWLGPAPWAPYHPHRCGDTFSTTDGRGFRSWYDYSGGGMTDWGGHTFASLLHGMGLDHTGPVEILPPDPEGEPPEILGNGSGRGVPMTFVFANGMKIFRHGGRGDYICEKGLAEPLRTLRVPPGLRWYEDGAGSPIADFINCIQTRKRPFRDVEYSHRAASLCHLGNICLHLNRKLQWDPDGEHFVNDPEADRFIDRPRRDPWRI